MPRYAVPATDVANTDGTHIVYTALPASPSRRNKLYELVLGSRASPADATCNYEVTKITDEHTTPAGTAITPEAIDDVEGAALFNAVEGATGAPTLGAILLNLPVHQRATYRWLANPGYEFVTPLTEDTGWDVVSDTPTTAYNVYCTLFVEE